MLALRDHTVYSSPDMLEALSCKLNLRTYPRKQAPLARAPGITQHFMSDHHNLRMRLGPRGSVIVLRPVLQNSDHTLPAAEDRSQVGLKSPSKPQTDSQDAKYETSSLQPEAPGSMHVTDIPH